MCPPEEIQASATSRLRWWWKNSYYRFTTLYICVILTLILIVQIGTLRQGGL